MSDNIGIKETSLQKGEIEKLQKDISVKTKQYNRMKYIHPLFTLYMKNHIRKLKNSLSLELSKANTKIGGQAFNKLISKLPDSKASLGSYENFLLGTDENMNPIFVDNMNEHMSLFGGSGSGKSVFLFNLMRQVLDGGGGATFIDGKGDKQMLKDFLSWANQYDRLDDVSVLDFSEKVETSKDPKTGLVITPTTNTFNIFKAIGVQKAVKVLKEVVAGKPGGKTDFFSDQALLFFDNCALILKYLSEKGVNVHLGTFSETVDLKAHIIQAIPAEDPSLPEMDQTPNYKLVSLNQLEGYDKFWMPPTYGAKEGMSYVKQILKPAEQYGYYIEKNIDIPDYVPNSTGTQEHPHPMQISEQLQIQIGGYSGITLAKLSAISTAYAHIFNSTTSDINFKDVIAQGKLVYIRIPKMNVKQNAPKIGSLLINAFVDAVSESLGKDIAISDDPLSLFEKERFTASPVYLLALDELGAFVQDSMGPLEELLSQARSVNVSTVVSSQEVAGLSDGGQNIFKEKIMSNTSTKVFLKIDDEATKSLTTDLIDLTVKELDHEGNTVNKYTKDDISTFLSKSEKGYGIVSNKGFTRFLTAYHEPRPDKKLEGVELLNK